ncbi:MAG: TraR/DksA C4-type zinc finger protein [Candidatus Kurthia intestinigallinarum]|uniref:TraR/DksA C4-type zinc finger protein n=1 Tax=Kurthia sp. Dielmo TaxID=1033738 RepID=UPI00111EC619|nr:TraR/DksA C4-type zinc finger protein [Kurthia sp. Dielmo]
MTDEQLKSLKAQLEQMKETLIQKQQNTRIVEPGEEVLSNHPAENASDLTEQTMELTLEGERDDELRLVQAALNRIERGTYGKCVVGGEPIPFERLEALPTADTCVAHAEQLTEQQKNRPVEEEVIRMNVDKPMKGVQGREGGEDSLDELLEEGSSDSPSDQ